MIKTASLMATSYRAVTCLSLATFHLQFSIIIVAGNTSTPLSEILKCQGVHCRRSAKCPKVVSPFQDRVKQFHSYRRHGDLYLHQLPYYLNSATCLMIRNGDTSLHPSHSITEASHMAGYTAH